MRRDWTPWIVGVIFVCTLCLLAAVIVKAQSIPMPFPFPPQDVAYNCVPLSGNSQPLTFKFTTTPSPHFQLDIKSQPAPTDVTAPVFVSVTNSAGIDVTAGAVRLLDANFGLPITVRATDDVGVVGGKLEVDGKLATPFGNDLDVLPTPFYVRWNAKTISAGAHAFSLTVWDAAGNKTVKTWSMTK